MYVTVIALKYALLASQSSYGHFLKQLIQFYLNNSINLRHSTERIKSCYTHKMAIVSWPTTMWRHFILCILIAKLRSYLHPDRNHNPHQNCLKLYFSTLQETCQIQKRQSNSKNRIYYLETSVWIYFRQLANARTTKNTEVVASVASMDQNIIIEQTHFLLNQRSAVNDVNFQQTLQREAFWHA